MNDSPSYSHMKTVSMFHMYCWSSCYFAVLLLTTWASILASAPISTSAQGEHHCTACVAIGYNLSIRESCCTATTSGCYSAAVFWSSSVILFENKLLLYWSQLCVSSPYHLHPEFVSRSRISLGHPTPKIVQEADFGTVPSSALIPHDNIGANFPLLLMTH